MKKLFLAVAVLATTLCVNAQDKEWKVGNDPVNFPVISGVPFVNGGTTIDGLTIIPKTVATGSAVDNMGQVEAIGEFTFNEVAYSYRFKFNGAGYSGGADTPASNMPTQRYVSFPVTGNCTIKVVGSSGSNCAARKLFVTDGSNLIGTIVYAEGAPDTAPGQEGKCLFNPIEGTVAYSGGAATLYMFCNAAVNLYNIKVSYSSSDLGESDADGNIVIAEDFYSISGAKLSVAPETGAYILVQTFDNGAVVSSKKLATGK